MKNMKRINFAGLFIILFSVICFAGCSDDDESQDKVETIKMYVSSETGTYYDLFDSEQACPMECMLVREEGQSDYDTIALSAIEGFTYEKGYEYTLMVKRTTLANPPADGSSYVYALKKIVKRTKVSAQ